MSRKTRKPVPRWFLGAFGVMWSIVGWSLAIGGIQDIAHKRRFDRHAQRVSATVTAKSMQRADSTKRTGTKYIVEYRFEAPGGRTLTGSAAVDADEWENIRPWQSIDVDYLPQEPGDHRLAGSDPGGLGVPGAIVGGVFGLVGTGILIWTIRTRQRTAPRA
jgi:hypothetical protein